MDGFNELLESCMNDYDVAEDENALWPNNPISKEAVFDSENGIFGNDDDEERSPISQDEVELCQRLAEAAAQIKGTEAIGLGSEGSEGMEPFWLVKTAEEDNTAATTTTTTTKITDELIRARFAGTLFPPITIDVVPFAEEGKFWAAVLEDLSDSEAETQNTIMNNWRDTMKYFHERKEFKEVAFVYIGDYNALQDLDEDDYPEGTEMVPSVMPRMVVGLTQKGSLVGLFGIVVQT